MLFFILFFLSFHSCSVLGTKNLNSFKKSTDRSSLVFIFDVTGSMASELDQVKVGASKILKELSENEDNSIYDYILVPFNDPEVGPVTKTTNATLFKSMLQELIVSGGTDCPEMSLTAIRKGLTLSLPNSYIFVFTDADPKDVELLPEILFTVREKNNQVIFVLTGNCIENQNSKEFQEIASVSTGQIFNILKNDVHLILDFVRLSSRSRRVNLLSVDCLYEIISVQKFNISIDETISNVVFTLSGKRITLVIFDPQGEMVNDSSCDISLNLDTLKLCSVQNPKFGKWKVIVNSFSSYSLRTSGTSNITFLYGFQTELPLLKSKTLSQPIEGTENFVLLQPQNSSNITSVTNCEILSLEGVSVSTIQIFKVDNVSNLYYGTFQPYGSNFHLRFNGITKSGFLFQRITPSAVYPASVLKVSLSQANQTLVSNQPFNLTCAVHSSVPFKVQWLKNGVDLNHTEYFSKSQDVLLVFPKLSLTDAGNYTCVVHGNTSKSSSTILRIFEYPSVEEKFLKLVNLKEYDDCALPCSVKGFQPSIIHWYYNISNEITIVSNNDHQVLLPDSSLLLLNVELNQSGLYSCVAFSEAGSVQRYYNVTVTAEGETDASIMNVKVLEGENIGLTCPEMKGSFHYQWLKNNSPLDMKPNDRADEPRYILIDNGEKLRILNVYRDDSALYSCVVSSANDSAKYFFFLHVLIAPNFLDSQETIRLSALAGENVTFDCTIADGNPKPVMLWKKSNFSWPVNQWTMPNVSLEYPKKQILLINHVSPKVHSGMYECIAKNEVALIKRHFQLRVEEKFIN